MFSEHTSFTGLINETSVGDRFNKPTKFKKLTLLTMFVVTQAAAFESTRFHGN